MARQMLRAMMRRELIPHAMPPHEPKTRMLRAMRVRHALLARQMMPTMMTAPLVGLAIEDL